MSIYSCRSPPLIEEVHSTSTKISPTGQVQVKSKSCENREESIADSENRNSISNGNDSLMTENDYRYTTPSFVIITDNNQIEKELKYDLDLLPQEKEYSVTDTKTYSEKVIRSI